MQIDNSKGKKKKSPRLSLVSTAPQFLGVPQLLTPEQIEFSDTGMYRFANGAYFNDGRQAARTMIGGLR